MKVILKFPLYVSAEFSQNIDRAKATIAIQKFLWPHVSELLEGAAFRRSVIKDLESASGCECSAKIVTERQLFQKLEK